MVALFNHSIEDLLVKKGNYIVQEILEGVRTPKVKEVDDFDDVLQCSG